MRFIQYYAHVEFMDGKAKVVRPIGGSTEAKSIKDGVLNLYYQDGEYAPRKDVISFPLANIRSYSITPVRQ